MSLIADRVFVVEEQSIEFSPEFRDRIQELFNEAVDRESEEHFLDGVETVFSCMDSMGLQKSRELVEKELVKKRVIEIDGDGGNENKEEESGEKKDEVDFVAEIAKMIC